MLTASPTTRVFVAREPVDMRGSFDALTGHARALGLDPLGGHLYVFFSRRRHMCAVLAFDRTSWCLFRKRLMRGTFELPANDPDLPLDNSASEREFQHVAKLCMNSLFAGGTEGAHRAAVLLGIAASCRRRGVDLRAYLTWVFVRVGTHAAKYGLSAGEITPASYRRTEPEG